MEIHEHIVINSDIRYLWSKIRNIDNLPNLFSEIDKIEVVEEDKQYNVWFGIDLGVMKRSFQSTVYITRLEVNKLVEFHVKNRHINVECRIELENLDGGTRVNFLLRTRPKNPLGKLIEIVLRERVGEYRKRLAKYLSSQ